MNYISPRKPSTGIRGVLERSGKISRQGRFDNNIQSSIDIYRSSSTSLRDLKMNYGRPISAK